MLEHEGVGQALAVRPATAGDVATLVAFQIAMARETEARELDSARVERGVRGVFEQPSRGHYLLAEPASGGAPVGGLLLTYEWSDWRAGTFWWIQSVYVLEAHRARGVFRALYEHVLESAREARDVCGVRLYVDHDNTRAQNVYARVGMSESHYRFFEVDFVLGDAQTHQRAPRR